MLGNIYYKNLKCEYSASATGLTLLYHNHHNSNIVLNSFRTYGIEYIRGAWACLLKNVYFQIPYIVRGLVPPEVTAAKHTDFLKSIEYDTWNNLYYTSSLLYEYIEWWL